MWKYLKIGESQVPQILCMIAGLAFVMMFQFTHKDIYAIVTLGMLQASCLMMLAYDEHIRQQEDERKANEEAFAMLEHKSL